MKKINTKVDFEAAISFASKISYIYDLPKAGNLPDYILELIKQDSGILPKHLSFSLFKELLIDELKILNPKYQTDEYSLQIIDLISSYSTRDERFTSQESFSFDKGILIMGKVGCGKTIVLKAYSKLFSQFIIYGKRNYSAEKLNVNYFPSYLVTEGFARRGFDYFNKNEGEDMVSRDVPSILGEILLIDDIGSENIVSYYGSTTNVIGELILRCYDQKRKFFATTNMDSKTLKAFYGDRVYSRMIEMMNFCVMEGEDRRK